MQHLIVDKRLNLTPSAASIAAIQPRSVLRTTNNVHQPSPSVLRPTINTPQPSPTSTIATPRTNLSITRSNLFSTEPIRNDSYHGEKLKGLQNYQIYRFQTKAWLEQRNLDHWLYNLPNTTIQAEKASHARAKSLFTVSIEGDQIPYIQTCDYVMQIWDTFETMYSPRHNLEQLTAIQIQLNNTKMNGTDPTQYLTNMRKLYNMAIALGDNMTPAQYIGKLIANIPDDKKHIRATLAGNAHRTIENAEQAIRSQFAIDNPNNIIGSSMYTNNKIECFYCGKQGHMKRECRSFKRDKVNNSLHPDKLRRPQRHRNNGQEQNHGQRRNQNNNNGNATQEQRVIAFFTQEENEGDEIDTTLRTNYNHTNKSFDIYADSASNIHVFNDAAVFTTLRETTGSIRGSTGSTTIHGIGTVIMYTTVGKQEIKLELKEARYVPEAAANILSLPKWDHAGGTFSGKKGTIHLLYNGTTMAVATKKNGMYAIEAKNYNNSNN
jgi:gag-polypeptide of LTR copia-type/Zinc knuckle